MNCRRAIRVITIIGSICVIGFHRNSPPIAVGQDDESKSLKADAVVRNRPSTLTPKRSTARYRRIKGSPNPTELAALPQGAQLVQVGITTWRFRPTTTVDKTKELVEEEGEPATEWTLERVEEGTPLSPGQRVRLSIESLSRDGYLYVINREQYADGTLGDPRLIFPTGRTPEGGNRVKAGKVISIPTVGRSFRIRPSQTAKVQVAEIIIILVSPKSLVDSSQLSDRAITLPLDQFLAWETKWGAPATRFEMEGGAGQAMTDKEQAAGRDSSQELTQGDPAPQSLYSVPRKTDDPILIAVPLKFGSTAARAKPN